MDGKTKAILIAGPVVGLTAAVAGAPLVVYTVGFTKGGVALGSLAAIAQVGNLWYSNGVERLIFCSSKKSSCWSTKFRS